MADNLYFINSTKQTNKEKLDNDRRKLQNIICLELNVNFKLTNFISLK